MVFYIHVTCFTNEIFANLLKERVLFIKHHFDHFRVYLILRYYIG